MVMVMASHAERTDQELLSYFDKSANMVRLSFRRIETDYIRPSVNTLLGLFEDHPILSTFLAVFSALSLLPLLSFIGFSLFVVASVLFVSLASALLVAALVISLSGATLCGTLAILFFVSLFLTASAVVVYLVLRFAVLIRHNDARAGVSRWVQELRKHFFHSDTDTSAPKTDEDTKIRDTEALIVDPVKGTPDGVRVSEHVGYESEKDIGPDTKDN